MIDRAEYHNRLTTSVNDLTKHYFNIEYEQELEVSSLEVELTEITLKRTWTLSATYQQKRLTGRYSGNEMGSIKACVDAAQSRCASIRDGQVSGYVASLEQHVTKDPISTLWSDSLDFGKDSLDFLHVYRCESCSGDGEHTCFSCHGRGHKTCLSCHGSGRYSCGGCGGSGRSLDGRSSCSSCGGSGKSHCGGCSGRGDVSCAGCHGRGTVHCGPCGATGFFTEYFEIHVKPKARLAAAWPPDITSWGEEYIHRALDGEVSWAPLKAACHPKLPTVERDSKTYPIRYEIKADLPLVSSSLSLKGGETRTGWFVGRACHPYYLHGLADNLFCSSVAGLADTEETATLRNTLQTNAAHELLQFRAGEDTNNALVCRQGLIGEELAGRFLTEYRALVANLNEGRSRHSLGQWVRKGLKYALVIMLMIASFDAVFGNSMPWENGGLFNASREPEYFLASIFVGTVYIWYSLLDGNWGPPLALVLFYFAVYRFFLSQRRITLLRVAGGLLATTCFSLFVFQLLPSLANHSIAAPSAPYPSVVFAALVNALILAPDALVVGFLLAALRLRNQADSKLKKNIGTIDCAPLMADLGYGVR